MTLERIWWLLIGGPAHGTWVPALNSDIVIVADPRSAASKNDPYASTAYDGRDVVTEGRFRYRIGASNPTVAQEQEIPALLEQHPSRWYDVR